MFVSFAGVTKIASIAEEVEDPDRVIPLGMLGSLAFTTLLYVLVVAVVVGVIPLDQLAGSTTPIAMQPRQRSVPLASRPSFWRRFWRWSARPTPVSSPRRATRSP